ncbi:DNA cytosine methyltransferase [Ochrobactrum grignonense]|nr:DNA cytosine methyltransferase [Brucella grignonensis]
MQTAIDLYSGCGGMSAGAAIAIPDLDVKWALDIDTNAATTFKKAHPQTLVDCCDVSLVSATDVIERAGIEKIDWFFAGPTCQAVSTMGVFHLDDPRNALFVHFIRLLDGFTAAGRRPHRVIMENVPGVVYGKNLVIVKELFKLFEDRGYHVFADVVNMADYGLPQLRNRFILIASLNPTRLHFQSRLIVLMAVVAYLHMLRFWKPLAISCTRLPGTGKPSPTCRLRRLRFNALSRILMVRLPTTGATFSPTSTESGSRRYRRVVRGKTSRRSCCPIVSAACA